MATLALFVALGGSSWAALKISGKNVKNASLTGRDIKKNSIGSRPIKESRLGTVPNAELLGGQPPTRFLVRCPDDTFPTGGTCIETVARPPALPFSAQLVCQGAGGDSTPGRRLPTYGELRSAYSRVDPAPGGELTGHVYPRPDGNQDYLYLTSKTGQTAVAPNDGTSPKAYRCAADPLN